MATLFLLKRKAFFTRMEPAETEWRWRNGSEKRFKTLPLQFVQQ